VLAFAGNETAIEKLEGWLICKGSKLDKKDYPDLFAAIGFANGGNGTNEFYLPDYRGYFLRGVDQNQGHDPNVNQRTAPASLGNIGDNPGSVQGFATALPTTKPFVVMIPHVPTSSRIGNEGTYSGNEMAKWTSGSTVVVMEGGPKETRPKNKYVYFIIKSLATTAAGTEVPIPIGAVVPIAGTNTSSIQDKWRLCAGQFYKTTVPANQPLYDAIGVIHGGDGNPDFYLPDYRGYFLRGVDGLTTNDPDATERLPPLYYVVPPVQGLGASGDNVGSMQSEQTANGNNKFTVTIPHLPTGKMWELTVSGGHDNSKFKELPTTQSVPSGGGGGEESRPKNVYVDWYIKAL
jgi:microcystin-dependent protein